MADDREVRQQELARLLLQKARQDLALVINVAEAEDIANEIIGFHVQQAVEKAIKAVLTRLGIQSGYTHDLSLLYQQVEEAGVIPPLPLEAVEELTVFAVQFRYMLFAEPSFDRKSGLGVAETFVAWADATIETSTQPPPDDEENERI